MGRIAEALTAGASPAPEGRRPPSRIRDAISRMGAPADPIARPAPRTPALAAGIVAAGRELTAGLPAVQIPKWLSRRAALRDLQVGDPAAAQRLARQEALAAQLAEEHPIATGIGTAGGFTPAMVAGGVLTKGLSAIPQIARLASGGRIARVVAEAVRSGAQFGAAEALQGRPQESPRGAALGAAFAPARLVAGRGVLPILRRSALGAATVGATSAALAPPDERLTQGVSGGVMGGIGGALTRPLARPAVAARLPGVSPYSFLTPAEGATIQEASQAAREGFAEMPAQPRPTKPLQTAKEIALERTARIAPRASALEQYQARYPEAFAPPSPKPGIVYPPGRVPRTRTAEGGFVRIPEEPEAVRAAGQAAVKAGAAVGAQHQARIQRFTEALREARPVRRQQDALFRKERGARMAQALAVRKAGPGGEAGFFRELGQLKGPLEKAEYQSIRSRVSPDDVNALMDEITSKLDFWPSVEARSGFLKMVEGRVPTESELTLLTEVFGKGLPQALSARRPLLQKIAGAGGDFLSSMRQVSAGFGDMSFGLRQAAFVGPRHPVLWQRAWWSGFRQYFSPKFFQESQRSIQQRPTFPLMQEYGLQLTGMRGLREEPFRETFITRLPGLRAGIRFSERAYTGMGNRLRADLFDLMVRAGKAMKLSEDEMARHLTDAANAINTMTGRGTLRIPGISGSAASPTLARAAPLLNQALFSPRLLASRLNLLDPRYYGSLAPRVRREVVENALAFLSAGSAFLGMAKMAGLSVGVDPTSADFGKVRVGNTRFDIWAGFQQPVRLLAQMVTGKATSSTTGREITLGEGYRPLTRLEILLRFFRSKQSPALGLLSEWLEGQTFGGAEVEMVPEVIERFIPMFLSDLYEVSQEPANAWMAPYVGAYSFFGGGAQTYGRDLPNIERTPSGRPTVAFRPALGLGHAATDVVTGRQRSNVPPRLRQPLADLNMMMRRHQADVDKAKRLVDRDARARLVRTAWGVTRVWSDRGVTKTQTMGRQARPLEVLERKGLLRGVPGESRRP